MKKCKELSNLKTIKIKTAKIKHLGLLEIKWLKCQIKIAHFKMKITKTKHLI